MNCFIKRISFVLFLLLLTACQLNALASIDPPEESSQAPPSDDKCKVWIGVITEDSDDGNELRDSYEIAKDEINLTGGIHGCDVDLDIRYEYDKEGDPLTATTVAELAERRDIPLILGAYSSGQTLIAAAETHRHRIPLIVPSASSDLITSVGYEWVFRVNAPSSGYASQALRFVEQTLAYNPDAPTIAVVYESTLFGESAAVAVTEEAENLGLSIVAYERYTVSPDDEPSNPAINAILARVRLTEPDVVYLISNKPRDARYLLQQSQAIDLQPQAFIANAGAFIGGDFLKEAVEEGIDTERLIITAQWSADVQHWTDSAIQEAFVESFEGRHETTPSMRAAAAHTILHLARDILAKLPRENVVNPVNIDRTRLEVLGTLHEVDLPHTLFGPINFDEQGQNNHPVLLVQVQGGRLVTIFPEEYQAHPWQQSPWTQQ